MELEIINEISKIFKDNYNIEPEKYSIDYDEDLKQGFIEINKEYYTVYPGQNYEELVSYIVAEHPELIEETIKVSEAEDNGSSITPDGEVLPLDESYPALLVALDSERDAEVTYKTLIEIEKSSDNPNQQVIELLEKILKEELQHIALLSALQANNNSQYVEDDSQEDFDNYIDEIVDDSK